MLTASQFVWGSIPTWALFVLALVVAWRVTKGGAGSAVSELSKANEVLTHRVHELGAEVRDLRVENATLRERTDVTLAIEPAVARIVASMDERFTTYDDRAIEWHQATLRESAKQLTVLSMIADRLGPDEAAAA